ncbi:MAG: hypothetical protein STSR0004_14600 [Peptococcaceae bacterium]
MKRGYAFSLGFFKEIDYSYNKSYVATDYTGVIEAMRAKKIDVAFFGPFSYVLAADRASAECFAVGVRSNGKSTYHSIIITHKDSGVKTLKVTDFYRLAFSAPYA